MVSRWSHHHHTLDSNSSSDPISLRNKILDYPLGRLVRTTEQCVVLGLLFAVWMNTNLCCDWFWLVSWYAKRFGTHGWSALLDDGISSRVFLELVFALFTSTKWSHDDLLSVQARQKVRPVFDDSKMILKIGLSPLISNKQRVTI